VKLAVRAVATALVVCTGGLTAYVAMPVLASVPVRSSAALGSVTTLTAPPVQTVAPLAGPSAWRRPTWFPDVEDVDAVADMGAPARYGRGPMLRSRSAFVYDLDANEVLVDKNADVVRPVASLTKLVSSLAMVSEEPNLETELCVSAAQYPTRSGARSRLSTGDCTTGWDVLGAALVASDNRAAYALAAVSGLDMDAFVARMDSVSAELDMDRSSWSDPSGLEDENLSTARDIARATVAVASHPVLAPIAPHQSRPPSALHHRSSVRS
jgi:D-alanyl-D-alanine carboxypeptidase